MEWIRPKVRALASLPGCLATHTKPLELTPADGNGGEELFQGSYNTRLRPLCSKRSDVTVSDLAAAWVRLERLRGHQLLGCCGAMVSPPA